MFKTVKLPDGNLTVKIIGSGLSVRELRAVLAKCPDQDAFVTICDDKTKPPAVGWIRMINSVRPRIHYGVAQLILGRYGCE